MNVQKTKIFVELLANREEGTVTEPDRIENHW